MFDFLKDFCYNAMYLNSDYIELLAESVYAKHS